MPKNKVLTLSVPIELVQMLEKEQKKYAYNSVQEVIIYSLRQKYLFKPQISQQSISPAEKKKKSRAGRPKNVDLSEAMTHKPFSGW